MSNLVWMTVVTMTLFGMGVVIWPFRKHVRYWLALPFLCGLVGLGYWHWGAWSDVMTYERQRLRQQTAQAFLRTIKDPEVLVQRLKTHLQTHPKSARGWYLLGRLLASQHRWDESLHALKKAYALKPKDDNIAVNYAQALFSRHQGQDAVEARHILSQVLHDNPQYIDALAMLAMDAQQRHAVDDALQYWQRLLALLPGGSEEAGAIRKAMVKLRAQR